MCGYLCLSAGLGHRCSLFRVLRPVQCAADRRLIFVMLSSMFQVVAEWQRQHFGTIRRFALMSRMRSEATTTRISIGSRQVARWIIGGAGEVGIMRWRSLELCMQVCVGKRCTCTTNLGCPTNFSERPILFLCDDAASS